MKRLLWMAVVTASLLTARVSSAGFKSDSQVYVSTASTIAIGAMGSARAAADATQYIGCINEGYSTGTQYILCFARNSAGAYGSCTSSDPRLISAAASITSSSFLEFAWNSAGTCTFLEVMDTSYFPPVVP
jgi:hypothetical protein